jgi:hypothetical protein
VGPRLDHASLATGIVVLVLGGLLLLDQSGDLDLSLGVVGALVAAVIGTVLLVSGLTDAGSAAAPPPAAPERDER